MNGRANILVCGHQDGHINFLDIHLLTALRTIDLVAHGPIKCLAFSDGKFYLGVFCGYRINPCAFRSSISSRWIWRRHIQHCTRPRQPLEDTAGCHREISSPRTGHLELRNRPATRCCCSHHEYNGCSSPTSFLHCFFLVPIIPVCSTPFH